MRRLHIVLVDHGIVHGGVYSRMPKELLHLLDGHALVDGMGGERPTEEVWVYAAETTALAEGADAGLDTGNREAGRPSRKGDEECRVRIITARYIGLEVALGAGVEVNRTLLVALAGDNALALAEVHVGDVDPNELSNPHAG